MKTIELKDTLNVMPEHDIIVVGGGVAGIAAAISAKREGKSVLLIEKSNMLGGLATLGLINWFVPMCNGRGVQICKGLCDEFVDLAIKYGYDSIPKAWQNGEPTEPTSVRYTTRYSPSIFALTLTEYILAEGVELLYDTIVTMPLMNDGVCEGLVTENKSGRQFYPARIVIDASGDCDVISKAGIECIVGENYFTYQVHAISLDSCKKAIETEDIGRAVYTRSGGTASLYGTNHPQGMPTFNGINGDEITGYLTMNQLNLLSKLKKENRKHRDVVTLPGMPQFREVRCIKGEYILKPEDAYKHFDDSVCAVCDFDRPDYIFEIPYRTMRKEGFKNLLTAGRSTAAEGYAWDVTRVIPPAILTGEAAGVAASMAIDRDCDVNAIDISLLQEKLSSLGVIIHFDDSLIPKSTL